MIKTAMILAAGRGERLRPYTDRTPKPLLPIFGKAMIIHLLERLRAAGIERCVINTCYLAEQLVAVLGDGRAFGLDLVWSWEEKMLGSGGGVVNAQALLGSEPFVVVSGDVYSDYDFAPLLQRDLQQHLAHAVLVPNPPYHLQGDYALDQGYLSYEGVKHTFAAIALLQPALLTQVPEAFSMNDVLRPAITAKLATGELFLGKYHNIGTVSEYQELQ